MDRNRFVKNPSEPGIRTFVAIAVPPALRTRLASVETLFAHHRVIKWVKPDLLHITLRFLGNVVPERLGAVERAARSAATASTPFELSLAGLGAFPNSHMPRVIWVGLAGDVEALLRLHQILEERLVAEGFPAEDRPFKPHLTLGRARESVTSTERRVLGDTFVQVQSKERFGEAFPVHEVIVMRSELQRPGPIYTPLASFRLGSEEGKG